MTQILTYLVFVVTIFKSLREPWIGVLAGYTFILMLPHEVWHWNFQGIPHFKLVAIPTLLGAAMALSAKRLDVSRVTTKVGFWFALWLLFITLSYYLGPHVQGVGIFSAAVTFETYLKSFVFFYCGLLCIDSDRKFRYLIYVAIAAAVVLTYWANMEYLDGVSMLHNYGRLQGPGRMDENAFAAMFVLLTPFLWYGGLAMKRKLVRYGLWMVIPLAWHAVFLTGSRGGLLGLGVSIGFMVLRSSQSKLVWLAVPALFAAYVYQGGAVLKERAATIETYQTEGSASARIKAWSAGSEMISRNPIIGVGLASYINAFPYYSSYTPRAAHNTLIQITAESGIPAGLAWLMVIALTILGLWRRPPPPPPTDDDACFAYTMQDATIASVGGFAACCMFLSLQTSEVFFYIGIVTNYLLLKKSRHGYASPAQTQPGRPLGGGFAASRPTYTQLTRPPAQRHDP